GFDPIGIAGAPVIDSEKRRIYFDLFTPDKERGARHLAYALSVADGSTVPGWPVDIRNAVPGFEDLVQHQRGGLTILGERVYIPYGAHSGDCGDYHGWVVSISTSNPSSVTAWRPPGDGAGIWAPSGIASDGTSLYIATGNGPPDDSPWGG